MIKSPITAPMLPKKAVSRIELARAISPRAAAAGVMVNTEVKNIPATKLPISFNSFVAVQNNRI